jgi:hypothetical protein
MYDTFIGAASFAGDGLQHWITSAVTSMRATFMDASTMNADLSGWRVAQVTSLRNTFSGASKFTGAGLGSWDTSSVTTLYSTFYLAGEMNADLSKWYVAKVTSLFGTFNGAAKFVGTGLGGWDTSKVRERMRTDQ